MKTSSKTTTARSSWRCYREYRDIVSQFQYVVETERRFYLANEVELVRQDTEHDFYFELTMNDVWVWDVYRSDRFVKSVRVLTFKDVNVEELVRQGARAAQGTRARRVALAALDYSLTAGPSAHRPRSARSPRRSWPRMRHPR